jgi:molecular chaperone DnaK
VHAKDIATDNQQQIRIEHGSGLTEDEVSRMIKEAEAHADEAHQQRELADARNLAESLAYQIELSLNAHRNKIEAADAAAIEGRIMALRQVLGGSALGEIRARTEALTAAAQALLVKPATRQPPVDK